MGPEGKPYLEIADCTWSDDSIRCLHTPSHSARQSFFYVQEIGYFKTSPPYFTERQSLSSFLLFCTLSGGGLLKYQDQSYLLQAGSLALIDCRNYHYYQCLPGQNWEFLWLHFSGATSLGYYESFVKNGFRVLREEDGFVKQKLHQLLTITQGKVLQGEILASDLIMDILTRLLLLRSTESLDMGFIPVYLEQVLLKLHSQFASPLTLDGLSQEFGVSKYHLSREFKRYVGTTIHEQLVLARISHAKELLKHTSQSVEQIAFACGFYHASHFIKLFKEHEKTTPLQFRKAWSDSNLHYYK